MRIKSILTILLGFGFMAGCGNSADEAPVESAPTEETDVAVAEEASEPEVEPEPEVAAISIPDELSELVFIPEGFIITKVDVVDEAQKRYHIEADVRDNVDNVQNSFIKLYEGDVWENDVNMSQKGSTTTGFNNGDFMVFVDAKKGNLGSIVKIDTGLL